MSHRLAALALYFNTTVEELATVLDRSSFAPTGYGVALADREYDERAFEFLEQIAGTSDDELEETFPEFVPLAAVSKTALDPDTIPTDGTFTARLLAKVSIKGAA